MRGTRVNLRRDTETPTARAGGLLDLAQGAESGGFEGRLRRREPRGNLTGKKHTRDVLTLANAAQNAEQKRRRHRAL